MSTAADAPARPKVEPVVVDVTVTVRAMAFREEDGRYSIVVPELPGCYSQADDLDGIAAQALEAATVWLDATYDARRPGIIAEEEEARAAEAMGRKGDDHGRPPQGLLSGSEFD